MTEAEWLACKDATAMLRFLRGRCGERKLRLLACACARARWPSLVEDEYRAAVETAERFAEGLATPKDLRSAHEELWCLGFGGVAKSDAEAITIAEATIEDFSPKAAEDAIAHVGGDGPALIREIFGTPFRDGRAGRGPRALDGRLREIALTIYENRLFEELPRFSDLLVDAGYPDQEIIAHLRSAGPHVRGCWALDVLVGKGPGKDVVTEAGWLDETHPFLMLTWWGYLRGEPSPRKRRLLACACCRLVWPQFTDERLRRAVEIGEAFADNLADQDELVAAHERARALCGASGKILSRTRPDEPEYAALSAFWRAAGAAASVSDGDHHSFGNAMHYTAQDGGRGKDTEDAAQAALVRDVLGNPLRQITLDLAWLRGEGEPAVRLARAIYDERAFERLPALATALERAGCREAELLAHCRGPGPHVRGCWVVDALLGNQ